jgi:hypothetical protein
MEPQLHQDQDGLKLALPIFHAACRQFIREEASPLDGVPDLCHLRTQADGLVHRAAPPGVSGEGRTSTMRPSLLQRQEEPRHIRNGTPLRVLQPVPHLLPKMLGQREELGPYPARERRFFCQTFQIVIRFSAH